MKSPDDITQQLRRQWQQADKREARLAGGSTEWPLRLPVGKPSAQVVSSQSDAVRTHLQAWRAVHIGRVEWRPVAYRATGTEIDVPIAWWLDRPSEWIAACRCASIAAEYATLRELCAETAPRDHRIWLRQRHLWRDKPPEEIRRASQLADALEAGCARGRPLRALSHVGIDTKFYERHRALLVRLLDQRHHGVVSEQGLEVFLDAAPEHTHWLLLADLDGHLLPFARQRVRASELAGHRKLPGERLLLVENERALHLLPPCEGTLAVLGSGNDLAWLAAPWLAQQQVAYWGDIDTWGLRLLAHARRYLPKLPGLLMDEATYQSFSAEKAVVEPEPAPEPRTGLSPSERKLFHLLSHAQKGRLEQEFLPETSVTDAIKKWCQPD